MNAVVYADGAGGIGGPAGIAYVAAVNGRDTERSMSLADATNQQAEILAAALALHEIGPCDSVILYSDSEYVVKGAEEWLAGWISRGWRTAAGSPVKNQRHWRRLIEARARHQRVQFRWVRGHAGVEGNERADRLAAAARAAAREVEERDAADELELSFDRELAAGTLLEYAIE